MGILSFLFIFMVWFLISLMFMLLDSVWTYCRPTIRQLLDERDGPFQKPKVSPDSVQIKKSKMVIIHLNSNKNHLMSSLERKRCFYWNRRGPCFADCITTRSADGIFSLLIIKGFWGYSFWRNALCIYHLATRWETAYISTTFASSAASQTCF